MATHYTALLANVYCLPGGLCTAAFDELFAEPAIAEGDVRLIATTVPGFGGVPLPTGFDATVESHAELAANPAADLGCDTVLGHGFGANIALEMADGGHSDGRLILLSPSFSREDEAKALAVMNRIGYVPGGARRYFEYLDKHGTLAGRLCRSGVSAEVAFGDADDDHQPAARVGRRADRRAFGLLRGEVISTRGARATLAT